MSEAEIAQAGFALLSAGCGAVIVLTRDPLKQVIVSAFQGLVLTGLFLVLMGPDVALAQAVVGALPYPIMVLLALARVRRASP